MRAVLCIILGAGSWAHLQAQLFSLVQFQHYVCNLSFRRNTPVSTPPCNGVPFFLMQAVRSLLRFKHDIPPNSHTHSTA